MKDYSIQTPEGVRDYIDTEMCIKDEIQKRLKCLYQSYNYKLIETPSFEYLDVFNDGVIQNKNIYSFVNRQGEILALRNDMTKSISRVLANKPFKRLCYSANIFRYTTQYHGMQNEFTQCGIELMEDSIKADAEAIRLAITSLIKLGIKGFNIHIGDTTFIKSIIDNLNSPEKAYEAIKQSDGVLFESVLRESNDAKTVDLVLELTSRVGKIDLLKRIKETFKDDENLDRLEKIYEYLGDLSEYVSFDFSMLSYGDYYEGVRFQGFVKGVGEAVLNGGRYISKNTSSVGFGININQLIDKVNYDLNRKVVAIGYKSDAKEAYKIAQEMIDQGYNVSMSSASSIEEIKLENADRILFLDESLIEVKK